MTLDDEDTVLRNSLRRARQYGDQVLLELVNRPSILCSIISEGSRYVRTAWVHDVEKDEDTFVSWDNISGVDEL